jgi:hypothetical protein
MLTLRYALAKGQAEVHALIDPLRGGDIDAGHEWDIDGYRLRGERSGKTGELKGEGDQGSPAISTAHSIHSFGNARDIPTYLLYIDEMLLKLERG